MNAVLINVLVGAVSAAGALSAYIVIRKMLLKGQKEAIIRQAEIDAESIKRCKNGFVLLNTSRGALVDSDALLDGIKSRKVGAACLDVYEEESDVFFEDNSGHIMEDDTLARLISMPNVIVTSHQAFLTEEALSNIAEVTAKNISDFFKYGKCENNVCYDA